jgi:hypothetical protein
MSELNDDRELRQAFAQFRSESTEQAPRADLGAVRRIARRLRARRLVSMSLTAVVAIAAPLAAYGLATRSAEPPDRQPAADRNSTEASGPPSAPASSPPPSVSASASAGPSRPVTEADIRSATALALPAWGAGSIAGCPSGKVDMTKALGMQPNGLQLIVWTFTPVDTDRDGDTEAVVTFYCGPSIGDQQVIVVGRDAAGALTTLGQVVATGEREPIKWVMASAADPDGSIRVQVADRTLYIGGDAYGAELQWRTYRWNGSGFPQVAGPRSFTPVPPSTDLAVSVTPTTLAAPSGGVRRGSATVTVTNRGPATAQGLVLEFEVARPSTSAPAQVSLTTATSGCTETWVPGQGTDFSGRRLTCHLPALAAGASRDYTFDVGLPESNSPVGLTSVASVKAEQPGVRLVPDLAEADNRATHPVTAN